MQNTSSKLSKDSRSRLQESQGRIRRNFSEDNDNQTTNLYSKNADNIFQTVGSFAVNLLCNDVEKDSTRRLRHSGERVISRKSE